MYVVYDHVLVYRIINLNYMTFKNVLVLTNIRQDWETFTGQP